jgi:hypothetical protein
MSRIVIVDNEHITVEYLPEKKIVQQTAHQPTSGQRLRDALNAGAETLKRYKACKWLSDDRKNGPFSLEDVEWGCSDWNRRTLQAGWKYWALITQPEVIAAGSLLPFIENLYTIGLRVMIFAEMETALQWLDGLPG